MSKENIQGVKFCVVRDYSKFSPGLGSVSCADFWKEEDAREYYKWQKRRWSDRERKHPGQHFVWKLYKRTDYYPGDKDHPSGCKWELLLGDKEA